MTQQTHCKYLLIEDHEFEYLTNQMENDHVIKIYEDVMRRIRCCNCGVPKQADGTPNCPDECAFSEQHDAAITAQERKKVLSIIHKKLKRRYHLMEDPHAKQQYAIVIHFVKSLRGARR